MLDLLWQVARANPLHRPREPLRSEDLAVSRPLRVRPGGRPLRGVGSLAPSSGLGGARHGCRAFPCWTVAPGTSAHLGPRALVALVAAVPPRGASRWVDPEISPRWTAAFPLRGAVWLEPRLTSRGMLGIGSCLVRLSRRSTRVDRVAPDRSRGACSRALSEVAFPTILPEGRTPVPLPAPRPQAPRRDRDRFPQCADRARRPHPKVSSSSRCAVLNPKAAEDDPRAILSAHRGSPHLSVRPACRSLANVCIADSPPGRQADQFAFGCDSAPTEVGGENRVLRTKGRALLPLLLWPRAALYPKVSRCPCRSTVAFALAPEGTKASASGPCPPLAQPRYQGTGAASRGVARVVYPETNTGWIRSPTRSAITRSRASGSSGGRSRPPSPGRWPVPHPLSGASTPVVPSGSVHEGRFRQNTSIRLRLHALPEGNDVAALRTVLLRGCA